MGEGEFEIPDSADEFLEMAGDDSAAPVDSAQRTYCLHRKVRLDPDSHRAHCRDCEREVDPWEVLHRMTKERGRWASSRDAARVEARDRNRELEAVKRDERNAKSRLRRAKDGLYSESEIVARLAELDGLMERTIDRIADDGNRRFALGLRQRIAAILDDPRTPEVPTHDE